MASDHNIGGEKIKLLHKLSVEEDLHAAIDTVSLRPPEWYRLEKAKLIPIGSAQILVTFHNLVFKDRCSAFSKNSEIPKALVSSIKADVEPQAVTYALTVLYDILRDDTSKYSALIDSIRKEDSYKPFMDILAKTVDPYITDKTLFLLTALISRGKPGMYEEHQINHLVNKLLHDGFHATNNGTLVALSNILKLNSLRDMCWKAERFSDVLMKNLSIRTAAVSDSYYAVFCLWLLTFDEKLIEPLVQCGLLHKLCGLLKECKTEKVIRLGSRTLVNCLISTDAVEIFIEQNIVQVLTLLEYEKWRDDSIYAEIQESSTSLQSKIRLLSNFDRYRREIQTGALKWSFLHSEKFWYENVMHFEENEFEVVTQLVALLKNPKSDNVTLEVACYDIGEFARLHPTGKKIIQRLQVKAIVMLLMSHESREVCREALLCTQKLMLEKWEAAITT